MKLSEAIRLGAMMRRKAIGAAFKDGGSCALGAALESIGYPYNPNFRDTLNAIQDHWPWFSVFNYLQITHKNDCRHYTRNQIADFIQSIEPQNTMKAEIAQETNPVQEEPCVNSLHR